MSKPFQATVFRAVLKRTFVIDVSGKNQSADTDYSLEGEIDHITEHLLKTHEPGATVNNAEIAAAIIELIGEGGPEEAIGVDLADIGETDFTIEIDGDVTLELPNESDDAD